MRQQADLVLLDEAAHPPGRGHEPMAVLRPMLATAGGRMIMLGTPLDTTDVFARVWHDSPADKWLKLRVATTECPRVKPEFLQRERLRSACS